MDQVEFDKYADHYRDMHARNIAATGEAPEYFHEYKVRYTANYLTSGPPCSHIVDFGSGIGNSIPFFRRYFPDAELICLDVSQKCLDLGRSRFPGNQRDVVITGDHIPLDSGKAELTFSACVFHHIAADQHLRWMKELLRVTVSDGRLAVFEHNPLNPLTAAAVASCPFDKNATLIRGRDLAQSARLAGWRDVRIDYCVFFPAPLSMLRPAERALRRLPLGAQYVLTASKA